MRRATLPVLLLSAAGLASCAGEPPRVASLDLIGSWRNEQGASLSLQDTGALLLTRPDPKTRPVVGEYTFDGDVVTLRLRPESRWCSEEVGTYRVEVAPDAFTATTVRDACKDRERLVKGRWQRTADGRITSDG